MKNKVTIFVTAFLTIGLLIISSFIMRNTQNNQSNQKPKIDEMKAINTTYSLRALLNSTTASYMTINESGTTATVTTTNTTPIVGDNYYSYLYGNLSFVETPTFDITNTLQY